MAKEGHSIKGNMRKTMFNQINTYGESSHMGGHTTTLNSVTKTEHLQEANITSAQMRKTMKVGLSPKSKGAFGSSPLNASGGMRRSTHKSPANQSHK
jgi:hypothetical protein